MRDTLPVHLNRDSLHSLDVPTGIETDGSFDVLFRNHGEAIHVHLHLDDDLSEVATLDANNHYIQADSARPVSITVDRPCELHGKLKAVTSYGAQTRYVDIDLVKPDESDRPVQIDESLGTPRSREANEADTTSVLDRVRSPASFMASFLLVLAALVALLVPSTGVRIGSGFVFLVTLVWLSVTVYRQS